MKKSVNDYISRLKSLRNKKERHRQSYEEVNRFVRLDGQLYEDSDLDWKNETAYNGAAPRSSRLLSSILMGLMFPSAKKVLRFNSVEKIPKTKENLDWYKLVQDRMSKILDSPEVGFLNKAYMAMYELVTFGTGGTFVTKDEKLKLNFTTWGIKNIYIDEGKNGTINTIYYEDKWTAKRICETYGEEKCPKEILEAHKGNRDSKFCIVQAIEPSLKKVNGYEVEYFKSIHFLPDQKHILKESKFDELPVFIARMFQDSNSVYGKSQAIEAMPAIRELNRKIASREYYEEQELNPAMGYDPTAYGSDVIDVTPGNWEAFNLAILGDVARPFRIIPPVNLDISDESVMRLYDEITQAFSIDRLLDFNNTEQMTATETQVRDKIRGQSSVSTLSIIDSEYFTPVMKRSFNILFDTGEFGVIRNSEEHKKLVAENEQRTVKKEIIFIPDEIAKLIVEGEDFYEFSYNSPATRMMQAEEITSLKLTVIDFLEIAQAKPEILLWLNEDEIAQKIVSLRGAPQSILRALDEVQKIKENMARTQMQQQGLVNESQALDNAQKQKELVNE